MDMETNPFSRRSVPAGCRILCSNVRGLAGKLSDLTVVSYPYDVLFCSETLVSDPRYVSELPVPGFLSQGLVMSGQDASGPWDGCIRTRWLRSILPTQI